MKTITSYNLPYQKVEDVTKVQENGDKLTTKETVTKKLKVAIKEPSRREIESANNAYQESWSDCVRRGIVTRAIIDKNYRNAQGFLTDGELKSVEKIQERIQEISTEYKELEKTAENLRTPEQKEKIKNLLDEFSVITQQLDSLEDVNESLYQNTAESIAFGKKNLWNLMFLTYIEKNGTLVPIVQGDTVEERLEAFDNILEDESSEEAKEKSKLYDAIITRNGYYINMLSRGKLLPSQLAAINETIEKENIDLTDNDK